VRKDGEMPLLRLHFNSTLLSADEIHIIIYVSRG
jgi:hypothetical protein